MGIGVSIVLIAVGAVLRWAITADVSGVNIHTVGLILLIVGAVGLVTSLLLWSSAGTWYPGRRARREKIITRDDYDDRNDLSA